MRRAWETSKMIVLVVIALIAVHGVNLLLDGELSRYGIIPRSQAHWYHIFAAPFLHGNWQHVLNNCVGIVAFSFFSLARGARFYLVSSFFIIAIGGALVWCFARPAVHIGASGWVFGLWSMTIAIAFFDRSFSNVLIAIVVAMLYSGMIFGVLPQDPRISFEAHLFGAIAGVVVAFFYGRLKRSNNSSSKKAYVGEN